MRNLQEYDDFVNEVKAGRAWEGRLKRIDQLLAWMYDKGILSKRDKAKKDSLFNQYYRYYNDGDFPRVVRNEYTTRAPKSGIEDSLERHIEDFIKDVLSRYAGKYDRQEFRLDSAIKHLKELKEAVADMDVQVLIDEGPPSTGGWDNEPITAAVGGLRLAHDRLKKVIASADPDASRYTVRAAKERMQKAGTWHQQLSGMYADVAALVARIGVMIDDVLHAAEQARSLLGASVRESASVNEATYVGKKHDMLIEDMRVIVGYMCDNISDSPDFESTRKDSEAAIGDITKAFTNFYMATKKAMAKVGTNYAGT